MIDLKYDMNSDLLNRFLTVLYNNKSININGDGVDVMYKVYMVKGIYGKTDIYGKSDFFIHFPTLFHTYPIYFPPFILNIWRNISLIPYFSPPPSGTIFLL